MKSVRTLLVSASTFAVLTAVLLPTAQGEEAGADANQLKSITITHTDKDGAPTAGMQYSLKCTAKPVAPVQPVAPVDPVEPPEPTAGDSGTTGDGGADNSTGATTGGENGSGETPGDNTGGDTSGDTGGDTSGDTGGDTSGDTGGDTEIDATEWEANGEEYSAAGITGTTDANGVVSFAELGANTDSCTIELTSVACPEFTYKETFSLADVTNLNVPVKSTCGKSPEPAPAPQPGVDPQPGGNTPNPPTSTVTPLVKPRLPETGSVAGTATLLAIFAGVSGVMLVRMRRS